MGCLEGRSRKNAVQIQVLEGHDARDFFVRSYGALGGSMGCLEGRRNIWSNIKF